MSPKAQFFTTHYRCFPFSLGEKDGMRASLPLTFVQQHRFSAAKRTKRNTWDSSRGGVPCIFKPFTFNQLHRNTAGYKKILNNLKIIVVLMNDYAIV
jgi:hypothetical protein